jgi:hypothetical protein
MAWVMGWLGGGGEGQGGGLLKTLNEAADGLEKMTRKLIKRKKRKYSSDSRAVASLLRVEAQLSDCDEQSRRGKKVDRCLYHRLQ